MNKSKLELMSRDTSIPFDGINKSFGELKRKGFVFTKANNPEEMFGKNPVRLAFQPPFQEASTSSLSLGPFCLDKRVYESLYSEAKSDLDEDAWKLLIAFQRIQYEKLGIAVEGYAFQMSDDPMSQMLHLIEFWDLENPVIFDSFVWIEPTIKAKEFAEQISEKIFPEDDYSWWNVLIDFGEDFTPTLPEDYPDKFTQIPKTVQNWQRYIPIEVFLCFQILCQKLKANGNFEYQSINSSSELISLIEESYLELGEHHDEESYSLDRRMLIKELLDYNSIVYPYNANTIFDFLIQIGFLKMNKRGANIEYQINKKPPYPKRVINIYPSWENKMDEFLKTGSILFAYLSIDEILSK